MMWDAQDGMGWWLVFGGMWMVVFWGIVIGLVIWGIGRLNGNKAGRSDASETPIEIASKRLGRGEITTEEFEEIRSALQ